MTIAEHQESVRAGNRQDRPAGCRNFPDCVVDKQCYRPALLLDMDKDCECYRVILANKRAQGRESRDLREEVRGTQAKEEGGE